MDITTTKSQQIFNWLLDRGISEATITKAGLQWNGKEIVIPVFNERGIFLFNKYRRDPFTEDESIPKYRYEIGNHATLYNAHTIAGKHNETIFVVEGELDCLRLNSLGLNAVSSTGGSGTFRKEWTEDFSNNDIYIVYDHDDAGIKGALKVNELCPHAKIVFLPYMPEGKDVTDYFKENTIKDFQAIIADSSSWVITSEPPETPHMKIQIHGVIKAYQQEADMLLEKQRVLNSEGKSIRHIEMMTDTINERIEYWRKHYANIGKVLTHGGGNDIKRAKLVPIPKFLVFNRQSFSTCLWHQDSRPSLHYIEKTNRVFCFSCNASKDSIDVVMAQRDVEFPEALKIILNK